MSILTLEGIVDHGHIRLPADVHLPERTKVYVLVPAVHVEGVRHAGAHRVVVAVGRAVR